MRPMTPFPTNDPWRAVCPNGHTSWTATPQKGGYRCEHCGRFNKLHDARDTGRPLNPAQKP